MAIHAKSLVFLNSHLSRQQVYAQFGNIIVLCKKAFDDVNYEKVFNLKGETSTEGGLPMSLWVSPCFKLEVWGLLFNARADLAVFNVLKFEGEMHWLTMVLRLAIFHFLKFEGETHRVT